MNTTAYTKEIISELQQTLDLINGEEAEKVVDGILRAKKIFVAGGGRSGFMAKAFVMRMMHVGLDAYVVGETVTPNLEPSDIFIVGSGSGETGSMAAMTKKAKGIGATVVAVTINPDSTIGNLADIQIEIPAQAKAEGTSGKSIQPMGSLFEQSLLLFYDAVILRFMDKKGLKSDVMYGRHANLE
ncbi:6-phospho-3-hexuloisomerase [Alkalihalophilus marmarensis]|jgi:6-phospho-3-hexuloisomerase|uniref:3-hexulose-6-phosphate isomerase n=1 Tax=Alkalihalophilus marmarensis DSM 21297 TaxID=1188261 RepID=U6SN08_9BACI|nr:6-phospho-3-hexuloisomerase [Alkalihalophilus marmarensis]ERN52300.1 3-hexulose-6-phosphate isomerase [Alkalihalophilus marmarensis DSM 21297]MCM3491232.1 6-phospho-3-hexuloisomerase [Alkalihalophilus marmarensis]